MVIFLQAWQFIFAGFLTYLGITKCVKVILLQSTTDCYYKMCQVLQSVTDFITKCIRYYKI